MRKALLPALALTAAIAGYVGYPYATAYRLRDALAANDQAELDRLIDFARVRAGLKRDLPELVRSRMIRESEGWFAQLGAEIALELSPELLARQIDSKTNPASAVDLIVGPGAKSGAARNPETIGAELDRKLRTLGFVGPMQFDIELGEPSDPPVRWIALRLTIDGLTWRVTRLIPPGAPRER
jgi:hypothetical protein